MSFDTAPDKGRTKAPQLPADRIKLLALDVEGTLTRDPTLWELMHRKIGTWESHGEVYWRQYQAGELGYDEFARKDVATWKGASAALLESSAAEVKLMPGASDFMRQIHDRGIRMVLISNGLGMLAERIATENIPAKTFANHVIVEDGRLTGELDIQVPYHEKGRILREYADALGIGKSQIAAVGDGRADIAMFECAGLSIAFRPSHQEVADAAMRVARENLSQVLVLIA